MNIIKKNLLARLFKPLTLLVLCLSLPIGKVLADDESGIINLLFIGHEQREGSGYHLSHVYAPLLNQSLGHEKIRMEYHENLGLFTPEGLARFDAVMLYANYDELKPEQEKALLDYVDKGGAFLPIHSASACFGHSDNFVKLVGGRFHSHGYESFTTRTAPGQENHPVIRGFSHFETKDETYIHRDHHEQGRTVLMLRDEEPWTWVREQGKGRVFYTAYGHDENTWGQLAFHELLIRGILWSVGDEKREANRALVKSLPKAVYEDKGTIPNYRRISPPPQFQNPLSADDSVALTMEEQGFELQLFVSEPDIVNPVAFTWDERGRLFVVESVDYPNEVHPESKGNDRITVCEDTNGDGRADQCSVFADGLNIPTGIVAVNGGFIVSQAPHFLFLKDTDDDGKADVREIINSVWGIDDTHAGPSNLRYGHDNRIWGAVGYSGTQSESQGEFQNGLYRMDIDGTNIEPIAQLNNNTWGLGLSEDFEVFGSTANNAPAWHVPVWRNFLFNKHEGVSPGMAAKIDSFPQLFPVTHNFLQVDAHGRYTAGSGFNLYTARAFPKHFWNSGAFIGEPTAHLLGQFFLNETGSTYQAHNRGSLIASSDEWFSPVYADVGPDGQLWIADWYNFIIQHNPTPNKAAAGFDAELGAGNAHINPLRDGKHGRIYRLIAKQAPAYQPLDLSNADTATLVSTLANDNMFWRMTAQRKLVQEKRTDAIPALRGILTGAARLDDIGLDPRSIHAIWTLQGLGAFTLEQKANAKAIQAALKHTSAATRKNAVRALLESGSAADLKLAAAQLQDSDAKTRLWALLAMAQQKPSKDSARQLLRLRTQLPTDEWLAKAFTLAALQHGEHYWNALNRTDISVKGDYLSHFESLEQTPEYLLAKDFLGKDKTDFDKTLTAWQRLSDGRLPLMTLGVLDSWRASLREPTDKELANLQKLLNTFDSEAQMAFKLRASGLALDYNKVDDAAYAKYHEQYAFQPRFSNWGSKDRGAEIYQQYCASCHSGDASGDQALGAPVLAGMDSWYIQIQLQKFLAGLRGTHFKDADGISMRASLEFIQPEHAVYIGASVGNYLASLPRVKPPVTLEGDAKRGAEHFVTCVACHGADGKGNRDLESPSLIGQADWYLLKQLEKYQAGARGHDPRDLQGQQMSAMSKLLPDAQALKDVVAYIRSLAEADNAE